MNDVATVSSRVSRVVAKVLIAIGGLLLGLIGGGIIALLMGLIEIQC